MNHDSRQQWNSWFQVLPNPFSQPFAGGVLQALHLIQEMVVETVIKRTERGLEIREIHHPSKLRVDVAAGMEFDPERMAVQSGALVTLRNVWESVCGFDGEGLEDFHGVDCMPVA